MNRLVCTRLSDLTQVDYANAPTGARRFVFVSVDALGWSTYAHMLAKYSALRDDMDCVHVLVRPPLWLRAVNRLPVDPDIAWSLLVERGVLRRLPLDQIDLVHFSPAAAAHSLARRTGTRYSVSIDATWAGFARQLGGPRVSAQRVDAERRVYNRAAAVIAWSQWARQSLLEDYGIPQGKTMVAPPASELPPPAMIEQRSPAGRLARILFVGNDWLRKGGPRLLRWHQQHWAHRAELWVASARAPADQSCRNVRWLGVVPNARLITEIFPQADLFVLPTSFDQLGYVLAEAAAAGLPAVASRMAGLPELVEHDQTGFLVDYTNDQGFIDAITRLLDDSKLLARMSRATYERAKTWLNGSVQFNRLFDRLLEAVS